MLTDDINGTQRSTKHLKDKLKRHARACTHVQLKLPDGCMVHGFKKPVFLSSEKSLGINIM